MSKIENGNFVPKENEKIEVEQIEGTPYAMVKGDESCFIQLGKYRISPVFKDEIKLERWYISKNLKLMADIIGIIFEGIQENNLKIKKDE